MHPHQLEGATIMAKVTIEFSGSTPLLCHNIRLSDPDDPITKAIAEITSKRKKTDEDRKEIGRLEWFGGLYTVDGIAGPVMPTGNLRKCLIQAAKISRLGTAVQRALHFHDLYVPIIYDGPKDAEHLSKDTSYIHRASVGVGQNRVIRVRPQFPSWAIVASAELLEDVLGMDDLKLIVARAGLIEGLGDNRVNGYGRFEGQVAA
jgi:hypothetical protein